MRALSTANSMLRHTLGAAFEAILVLAIIAALALGLALAYGSNPPGAGSALAVRNHYTGWLKASPDTLQAGDLFDVHGCDYNTAYGNVVIGFTGGSWGSKLDDDGCFTITDIPALSGDTLPPGTYGVSAYQYVRHKWVETGETTVTVVK